MSPTQRVLLDVLGTSLGMGFIPGPRGTWGTIPAVVIYIAIAMFAGSTSIVMLASVLALSCFGSVILGNWAERRWGKDPGRFTLDEVAGFMLTMVGFFPGVAFPLPAALWGFILTRAFDITKPFPGRRLEKLPGGWGILLDDLMCSVYAIAGMYALWQFAPFLFQW